MDRITGADWVDIGGGRRGFRDQNRAAGVIGTEVSALFLNGIQEEIIAVIESEGIALSNEDFTLLLQAIRAKIEAVRVLQPIYPEVLTANGRFTVTQTAPGVVSVAAGTTWVMRGGKARTSVLTPLVTAPSKTYHLRFRNDAFALFDLASLIYNPTGLPDANKAFDSTYDDVLVARVVTNGANVATPTALSNRAQLSDTAFINGTSPFLNAANGSNYLFSRTLNWARTPAIYIANFAKVNYANVGSGDCDINFTDIGQDRNNITTAPTSVPVTRYGMDCIGMWDFSTSATIMFTVKD